MHILLAQNALYYPAYGGGDRSNRDVDAITPPDVFLKLAVAA